MSKERKKELNKTSEKTVKNVSSKKSFSRMFSLSLFVSLLSRFTDFLYNTLINSFLGHIFTAYSSEQLAFERGAVRNYFHGGLISTTHSRKIKQNVERVFETSFFINKIKNAGKHLLRYPLKTYGSVAFFFGIYTALIYALKMFFWGNSVVSSDVLWGAGASIIVSMPLLSSSESLGKAIKNGRFTSAIFVDVFGFKDEDFDVTVNRASKRFNLSILFGMLAGLLTFIVPPAYMLIFLLICIFFSMIFVSPEIGIIISIFMLPFCSLFGNPSIVLSILAGLSAFSYLIKLFKGKRIFKVELIDLSVIAFGVIILMGGIISIGGKNSLFSALMSCVLLLGFFCVVNLMRTEKWLNRCVLAVTSSSVIVSFIGVFEYILGFADSGWVDVSKFGYIEGRATSLFDNPNILAMYLVLSFPLLLAKTSAAATKKGKFIGVVSVLTTALCIIFTWSRGAWLALIVSTLLFLIIKSRKTLTALIAFLLTLPAVVFFIPAGIRLRFASIGDITDSSTYYRVYTWRGTFRAIKEHIFTGLGYGQNTFAEIYPQYAYAGMEAAQHSHSLFLQILFEVGIFGLLVFALFLLFFAQKNFEHLKHSDIKGIQTMSSAAFCAVVGALVMGLFDNIWYNYRIFFLFWVIAAISCAYVRLGDRERKRNYIDRDLTSDNASIDI